MTLSSNQVVLAADAHGTTDAVAAADLVVRHHNDALANLAHPDRKIIVLPSAEIGLGSWRPRRGRAKDRQQGVRAVAMTTS
jgi:hypothetical protein